MAAEPQVEAVFAPARRRWPFVLLGALLGVGGVLGAQWWQDANNDAEQVTSEPVVLDVVTVATTDLVEDVEWAGEVVYGGDVSFTGGGGTITAATPAYTVLDRGDVLLVEDNTPRVVIFGETPPFRTMSEGDEGPDVLDLETNLVALGYDTIDDLDVDGVFTAYTKTLVENWQLDIGAEVTGTVRPEALAVVDGPSIIRQEAAIRSRASGVVASVGAVQDLRIDVPVDVADADDWLVNQVAKVVLLDGSTVDARVEEIGTVVTSDNNGTTVDVVLRFSDAAADILEGPVTVIIPGETVLGATVVPTRALIALIEGGFAVEKDDGAGGTRLVGVDIGAFDDGWVEITNGALSPGDQVVVPQ